MHDEPHQLPLHLPPKVADAVLAERANALVFQTVPLSERCRLGIATPAELKELDRLEREIVRIRGLIFQARHPSGRS